MKAPPAPWPRISPAVYYDDARKGIAFLCDAFGFEVHLLVDGEGGKVAHSELVYGGGLVMVGEGKSREDGPFRKSPRQVGGANTQNLMVYVDDVDAHCARARAAGAVITTEPKVVDYGADYWKDKSYEAEDIDGHRWWFTERLATSDK